MDNLRYTFSCINFLNANEKYLIYKNCKCIYDIFNMHSEDLIELSIKTNISLTKLMKITKTQIKTFTKVGTNIRITDIYSEDYPFLLKNTFGAPIVLYHIGKIPKTHMISVVGSRNPSEYGKQCAFDIAYNLSLQGFCIVSGMAKGIDGISHMAALENTESVAVMGNGVDVCYPSVNRTIYNKLLEKGCVISEYPPNTTPEKYFFPQRNRIISGLSFCTVIIEASEKSGSLITAGLALAQDREVYCLPNYINSGFNGTNCLIKDGAGIITDIGLFCQEMKCLEISQENLYHCKSDEWRQL